MSRSLSHFSTPTLSQSLLRPLVSVVKQPWIQSAIVGVGMMMSTGIASYAAETAYVTYGSLESALSVAELQAFADTGVKSPKIAYYHALLGDEAFIQIRAALTNRVDLPVSALARFFSTPSGYRVLETLTDLIQARSESVDSVIALRTALILAAADNDSLSVMNLLRFFPDEGVQLNMAEGLRILGSLQEASTTRKEAIALIKQRSHHDERLSRATPQSETLPPSYGAVGPFSWNKSTHTLTDQRPVRLKATGRSRSFSMDLYMPQASGPMPVVIVSHGLGEGLSAYRYFAEHLASHGYVVAIPEHPGSSASHWRDLLESQSAVISNPQEFINRPLDIQHVLDVLTAKNQNDPTYQGRLDLNKVGLFGHSYGGYTALASAGAQLDFDSLQQTCAGDIVKFVNPSSLLQCQAQTLTRDLPPLLDTRIKAVLASQPAISALLGSQGMMSIQVPVALLSGGEDMIAPLVAEQLQPFQQLTASDRYLVLLEQADHYSMIGDLDPNEELFEFSGGASSRVNFQSRKALKSLGLGFFQMHLGQDPNSFMALVRSLNDPSFPVYGVENLDQSVATVQDDSP